MVVSYINYWIRLKYPQKLEEKNSGPIFLIADLICLCKNHNARERSWSLEKLLHQVNANASSLVQYFYLKIGPINLTFIFEWHNWQHVEINEAESNNEDFTLVKEMTRFIGYNEWVWYSYMSLYVLVDNGWPYLVNTLLSSRYGCYDFILGIIIYLFKLYIDYNWLQITTKGWNYCLRQSLPFNLCIME